MRNTLYNTPSFQVVLKRVVLIGFMNLWTLSTSNEFPFKRISDSILSDFPVQSVSLSTTLCVNHCSQDCKYYISPVKKCYNGNQLYPGPEEPFGDQDILDELIFDRDGATVVGILRSFFSSNDSTCTGDTTDEFKNLPLSKCIGPFGAPRPWGILNMIANENVLVTYE